MKDCGLVSGCEPRLMGLPTGIIEIIDVKGLYVSNSCIWSAHSAQHEGRFLTGQLLRRNGPAIQCGQGMLDRWCVIKGVCHDGSKHGAKDARLSQ